MKQYVIDDIGQADYEKMKNYLDENFKDASMDGIYWIPIDEDLLDDVQKEHDECQPFYFAVEAVPERIVFELLLRTKNRMRCDCMKYANRPQRNWLIECVDSILQKLEILA
jgi:hypothetical protein